MLPKRADDIGLALGCADVQMSLSLINCISARLMLTRTSWQRGWSGQSVGLPQWPANEQDSENVKQMPETCPGAQDPTFHVTVTDCLAFLGSGW